MKKENNSIAANKKAIEKTKNNNNTKGKVSAVNQPAVSGKVKPKSGRGLANEGTIVSYEGER